MPREFIAPDGRIFMRTKRLCQPQAERFAACLQANTTRFCDVEWRLLEKAKGEKVYFVQFRPVSAERQWAQYERQNHARRIRAMQEGACYVFALDTDGECPFYWTFNPKSGETYQTDSMTCSCPDFQYRCRKLIGYGVLCKHVQALLYAYKLGEIMPLADVYDTPEWKAKHSVSAPASWPFADVSNSLDTYEEARP